jgi:acyl-coenzyme A thioesterase PaaI-like protein
MRSVADSACGYAALTLAPSGAEVLTVEFKISLLAPADGLRFLAIGSVLRTGKKLSFCSGEVRAIRESGEELIATMLSTIITKTV